MTEKYWRLIICILATIYLFTFYMNGQNGRYTTNRLDDSAYSVLDTRTGRMYGFTMGKTVKWFYFDPVRRNKEY